VAGRRERHGIRTSSLAALWHLQGAAPAPCTAMHKSCARRHQPDARSRCNSGCGAVWQGPCRGQVRLASGGPAAAAAAVRVQEGDRGQGAGARHLLASQDCGLLLEDCLQVRHRAGITVRMPCFCKMTCHCISEPPGSASAASSCPRLWAQHAVPASEPPPALRLPVWRCRICPSAPGAAAAVIPHLSTLRGLSMQTCLQTTRKTRKGLLWPASTVRGTRYAPLTADRAAASGH
jgi:hypothetical protein